MMLSKKFLSGAALTALGVALTGTAGAQETTSSLRGEVVSTDGRPIAGATVVITHEPTGTRARTTTNEAGVYDARGLRIGGPYSVEFDAQNYRGERYEGLTLTLGVTERLDVDLESSAGEIVVSAAPRAATALGSATSLSRTEIASVVSITRDLRDLARRDPLVTQDLGVRGGGGAGGVSIGGSAARSNRIAVDGVGSGDDFGLNTSGLSTQRGPISLEAVEQFAVEAAPLDVENGDFNGGSLTIALRSGTNKVQGSAFVNYRNDGMVGQSIAGRPSLTLETQENYGGFLSGPILKDRLFFAASYEFYESSNLTGFGLDGSFANRFNGITGATSNNTSAPLTQADFDALISSFRSNYAVGSRFQVGGIPLTQPVSDEKYSGKLDWNINDQHRLTYTHRFSESQSTVRNVGQTNVRTFSNWYLVPEEERVNTLQLNSNWTDRLSTEARYSYREYVRGQVPPLGRDRGEVQVCLEPGAPGAILGVVTSASACENQRPQLYLGPDFSRQFNALDTSKQEGQLSAEYSLGDFLLKAGAQFQQIDIDNSFLQGARGTFYFDTLSGFNSGDASRLQFAGAVSGNLSDAASKFQYTTYAAFAQASWDVTPQLTLTGGLRYELYQSDDAPVSNPNFVQRIGFSNNTTYDGLDVVMPRFSAEWQPTDAIEVTGSVGLVSGGIPDVFLSNSFSNTGFVSASIDVQRTATGCTETISGRVLSTTDCAILLSGYRTNQNAFFQVPSVAQSLVSSAGAPLLATVNALDKDFEIPSDWRINLSSRWDVRDWLRLGFDILGTVSNEGLAMRDGRSVPLVVNGVQLRTPDGRIRYDGLALSDATRATLGTPVRNLAWYSQLGAGATRAIGNGQDLIAYNPEETSWFLTAAISAQISLANGIDAGISYSRQESEDYGTLPLFATTATGIYGEQYTSFDPNLADKGRSNNEIRSSAKFDVSWTKAFVGDLKTRFTLFGEWREGYPLNLLQSGGTGRTATYGVNRSDLLLYVPNLANPRANTAPGAPADQIVTDDPRVVFANQATYDFVRRVQQIFELPQGSILEKSEVNNPDVSRMDLQISQELPGLRKNDRTLFTVDISNVLNLINDDWGVVREFSNRRNGAIVADYVCASNAGVAAGSGSAVCDRYLIQTPRTGLLNAETNQDNSRWYIQLGLKYQF